MSEARPPRIAGAAALRSRSSARRHLIQKSGDAADSPLLQHGEIRALDRAVDAIRAKAPGETDVVAIAIGLADQPEFEIRKALLDAGDQCVDTVKAVAAHQRVDIFRVGGPA